MINLTHEEAKQLLDGLDDYWVTTDEGKELVEILRAKLSEPEPEPVAVWELQEGGWDTIADRDWMESLPVGTKLYTVPPQREWQGLTNEEIKLFWSRSLADTEGETYLPLPEFARAIEAKLKEKNI